MKLCYSTSMIFLSKDLILPFYKLIMTLRHRDSTRYYVYFHYLTMMGITIFIFLSLNTTTQKNIDTPDTMEIIFERNESLFNKIRIR